MGLGRNNNEGTIDPHSGKGGNSSDSVCCSICLETVVDNGHRSWSKLQCGHRFHLDCIASAFNVKGSMQCPNCRGIEEGQWLYSDDSDSFPKFSFDEMLYNVGYYVGRHMEEKLRQHKEEYEQRMHESEQQVHELKQRINENEQQVHELKQQMHENEQRMHENEAQSEAFWRKYNATMSIMLRALVANGILQSSEVPAQWTVGSSSYIPLRPSSPPRPDIGLRPTYPEQEQPNQCGTTFMTTPSQPSAKRLWLGVQTQYRVPQASDSGLHTDAEYDPDDLVNPNYPH